MLVFLSPMQTKRKINILMLSVKNSVTEPSPFLFLPVSVGVQQEHTDTVQRLRFTLDFARCLMEVAGARGATALGEQADISHPSLLQQQSLVADQISSLSREWR